MTSPPDFAADPSERYLNASAIEAYDLFTVEDARAEFVALVRSGADASALCAVAQHLVGLFAGFSTREILPLLECLHFAKRRFRSDHLAQQLESLGDEVSGGIPRVSTMSLAERRTFRRKLRKIDRYASKVPGGPLTHVARVPMRRPRSGRARRAGRRSHKTAARRVQVDAGSDGDPPGSGTRGGRRPPADGSLTATSREALRLRERSGGPRGALH